MDSKSHEIIIMSKDHAWIWALLVLTSVLNKNQINEISPQSSNSTISAMATEANISTAKLFIFYLKILFYSILVGFNHLRTCPHSIRLGVFYIGF